MYNLSHSLSQTGADVEILALNTKKHFVKDIELTDDFRKWSKISYVDIDTKLSPISAFKNVFSNGSYHVERFYSEKFAELLKMKLSSDSFDIILIETVFFANYIDLIRENSKARIVLRAHNIEHRIWNRLAAEEGNPFKKMYLKFLGNRLQKAEIDCLKKVDAVLPVSDADGSYFRKELDGLKVFVTPIGLDISKYDRVETTSEKIVLFHLGAMDWMPNIEAVDWLLQKVWPGLSKINNVELHIAGASMPKKYFDLKDQNIKVYGKVNDAITFISKRNIMLVPVFSGSGIRVKILEGFAMRTAVISTTIGAEGIPAIDGEHIMIANSAEDFVAQAKKLINDPAKLGMLTSNANSLLLKHYENGVIAEQLLKHFSALLAKHP